jgi:hypothetical protein
MYNQRAHAAQRPDSAAVSETAGVLPMLLACAPNQGPGGESPQGGVQVVLDFVGAFAPSAQGAGRAVLWQQRQDGLA